MVLHCLTTFGITMQKYKCKQLLSLYQRGDLLALSLTFKLEMEELWRNGVGDSLMFTCLSASTFLANTGKHPPLLLPLLFPIILLTCIDPLEAAVGSGVRLEAQVPMCSGHASPFSLPVFSPT